MKILTTVYPIMSFFPYLHQLLQPFLCTTNFKGNRNNSLKQCSIAKPGGSHELMVILILKIKSVLDTNQYHNLNKLFIQLALLKFLFSEILLMLCLDLLKSYAVFQAIPHSLFLHEAFSVSCIKKLSSSLTFQCITLTLLIGCPALLFGNLSFSYQTVSSLRKEFEKHI